MNSNASLKLDDEPTSVGFGVEIVVRNKNWMSIG
jgi:hypothetical protein